MKNKRDNDANTYICLFIDNMKPNNESKDILNGIMGCNVFPPMGIQEKMYSHWSISYSKTQWTMWWVVGWKRFNLVCNIKKEMVKIIQNDGMTKWAKKTIHPNLNLCKTSSDNGDESCQILWCWKTSACAKRFDMLSCKLVLLLCPTWMFGKFHPWM